MDSNAESAQADFVLFQPRIYSPGKDSNQRSSEVWESKEAMEDQTQILHDLWADLIDRWKQDGLQVPVGVAPEQIRQFEARYGVAMPSEMANFFLAANGNGPNMDSDFFCFWPLDEVKLVSEELDPTNPDRDDYPQCFV